MSDLSIDLGTTQNPMSDSDSLHFLFSVRNGNDRPKLSHKLLGHDTCMRDSGAGSHTNPAQVLSLAPRRRMPRQASVSRGQEKPRMRSIFDGPS